MKKLLNENIINAAEWLKQKNQLESHLKELYDTCEHWVGYETDTYKFDGQVYNGKNLVCDFCGKLLNNFKSSDKNETYNDFYEKQKKLFEYKYNINR